MDQINPNMHPYLEALLRFLMQDTELKKHFSENDFFRPIAEVDIGIDALLDKGDNCLDIKSIWVGPQNSAAITPSPCNIGRSHSFQIIINIPCGEGAFYWGKTGNGTQLSGSFMRLSHYMHDVVSAVNRFNQHVDHDRSNLLGSANYDDIIYQGDRIIHPARNTNFMSGILDFRINIY